MRITWFCLLLMSFNLCKENETDALIARMIEDSINLGIDVAFKLIKIPIYVGRKIIWKLIKVPLKFVWDLSKIPFRVTTRIAWKLSKRSLKAITPESLQKIVEDAYKEYKAKKLAKPREKSRIYRAKIKVKNVLKKLEHKRQARRYKYKH